MPFNPCRARAFQAFRATLEETRKLPRISEAAFRDAWLARLREDRSLYASGWYAPPPHGLSVLFSSAENPNRISFESLRQESHWPGEVETDWNSFVFAYSSCVDRQTGLMGDFDVTLYFGNDPILQAHYQNCFAATDRLLRSIEPSDTSLAIFKRSEEIFAGAGLKNCVVSTTDVTPLDLGHTYPALPAERLSAFPQELAPTDKDLLRRTRKFLNGTADWPLEEEVQFTIEPQLRSSGDPSLPQIGFHYLARLAKGRIEICRDVDALIEPCLATKP